MDVSIIMLRWGVMVYYSSSIPVAALSMFFHHHYCLSEDVRLQSEELPLIYPLLIPRRLGWGGVLSQRDSNLKHTDKPTRPFFNMHSSDSNLRGM
jgi:hypothetical protein